jgi:hypothetical protein
LGGSDAVGENGASGTSPVDPHGKQSYRPRCPGLVVV